MTANVPPEVFGTPVVFIEVRLSAAGSTTTEPTNTLAITILSLPISKILANLKSYVAQAVAYKWLSGNISSKSLKANAPAQSSHKAAKKLKRKYPVSFVPLWGIHPVPQLPEVWRSCGKPSI